MDEGEKIRYEVVTTAGEVLPLICDSKTGRIYPQGAPEVSGEDELRQRVGALEKRLALMQILAMAAIIGYLSLWAFNVAGMF